MLAGNLNTNHLSINIPKTSDITSGMQDCGTYPHQQVGKFNNENYFNYSPQINDIDINKLTRQRKYHYVLVPDGFQTIIVPTGNNKNTDNPTAPSQLPPFNYAIQPQIQQSQIQQLPNYGNISQLLNTNKKSTPNNTAPKKIPRPANSFMTCKYTHLYIYSSCEF